MALSLIVAAGINYGAGIIGWLIIGAIAGALAGTVMKGGGYGIVGDIIVGIIGAFIGGFILSLLGIGANGLIATLVTAFVGACILIAILRAVGGNRAAVNRWRATGGVGTTHGPPPPPFLSHKYKRRKWGASAVRRAPPVYRTAM